LSPLKVGVVGVGYLGQHHARIYSEIPEVELVGVVDIDRERAREVAGRYLAVPLFDYRDLFGKVDAVSIVVPTVLHRAIAGHFLEEGINIPDRKTRDHHARGSQGAHGNGQPQERRAAGRPYRAL